MQRSTRAAMAALGLLSGACGYDITTRTMHADGAVATYRAPDADFSQYATFALVDKLGAVAGDGSAGTPVDSPALLAHIASGLEARGFVRAADIDPATPPAQPIQADLVVNVIALAAEQGEGAYWITSGGYWTPASWGYPSTAVVSHPWEWLPLQAKPGSLLIELLDLKHASQDQIEVVWAAVGYAIAGSAGYETSTALAAVDQAFVQSPYLHTGTGGAP